MSAEPDGSYKLQIVDSKEGTATTKVTAAATSVATQSAVWPLFGAMCAVALALLIFCNYMLARELTEIRAEVFSQLLLAVAIVIGNQTCGHCRSPGSRR